MIRFRLILAAAALWSVHGFADQADSLVVTTWGGAYESDQLEAYIGPFSEEFDTRIVLKKYNGGVKPLQDAEAAKAESWDVLDMTKSDALVACKLGLVHRLNHLALAPAPDGTAADEDFLDGSLLNCGVEHLIFSTVLAYNDQAFPDEKPTAVKDFFDIERFPGKRGLRRQPIAILEWALYSYDIPIIQIYDLLSTDRGMKLAFRKLDQIRDHIVWWETGSEATELLKSGEVAMSSGYYGRLFSARVEESVPVSIIRDGQFLDSSVWAIGRTSPRRDLAQQFIGFVTRTQSMAAFARLQPYGPTRHSAIGRIGLHKTANIPMLEHMPTYADNLETSIRSQPQWYSRTENIRQRRFAEWLANGR